MRNTRRLACLTILLMGCDGPVIDVKGGGVGYRVARAPSPATPTEWVAVAQEHTDRGDHGAAIRCAERAVERHPDDRSLQKLLAHLHDQRALHLAMRRIEQEERDRALAR
jgi:hypothetical protein